MQESIVNQKILRADGLKGKKSSMPTNIEKFHEVRAFMSIAPELHRRARSNFEQEKDDIQVLLNQIKAERRKPLDTEVYKISSYNKELVRKADEIIQDNEDKKLVGRKLTSLERSRVALKFI